MGPYNPMDVFHRIQSYVDHQDAFDDRFGRWAYLPAGVDPPSTQDPSAFNNRFGTWDSVAAGNPDNPRSPVLRELMKYQRGAAPGGTPPRDAAAGASVFQNGAPAVPFVPPTQSPLAPAPPASLSDRFGNLDTSIPGGAAPAQSQPMAMSQRPGAPPFDKDARYLVRVPISRSGGASVGALPASIPNASAQAQPNDRPGLFGGIPAPPYPTSSQADDQSDPTFTPSLTLNDWYDRWIKRRAQE
jgi:hypothetical protein